MIVSTPEAHYPLRQPKPFKANAGDLIGQTMEWSTPPVSTTQYKCGFDSESDPTMFGNTEAIFTSSTRDTSAEFSEQVTDLMKFSSYYTIELWVEGDSDTDQ